MTHSTLTWFSQTIKPIHDELFLIAFLNEANMIEVSNWIHEYDAEKDVFVPLSAGYALLSSERSSIYYWAYVPKYIDLKHGEGKQSQVPEEK